MLDMMTKKTHDKTPDTSSIPTEWRELSGNTCFTQLRSSYKLSRIRLSGTQSSLSASFQATIASVFWGVFPGVISGVLPGVFQGVYPGVLPGVFLRVVSGVFVDVFLGGFRWMSKKWGITVHFLEPQYVSFKLDKIHTRQISLQQGVCC